MKQPVTFTLFLLAMSLMFNLVLLGEYQRRGDR
jgi:hypothetical protein